MQTAINIKNPRNTAFGKEKFFCLVIGMVVCFISYVTERVLSLGVSKAPAKSKAASAKKAADKDTTVATLCAIGVALAVAAVVYVTMLFFVGRGYSDGIALEFIVASVSYVLVYKIVSFLTIVE